jgi:2,4-dienoyl-CoA reductase-like NADH-dependent reductase (Old Yellow Enzyme family)
MTTSALFTEWTLAGLRVTNRIVMAPMSTNRADRFGHVSSSLISYLKLRAIGGCGMIIVESATVDTTMGNSGRSLRLDDEAGVIRFENLIRELHASGALAVAQIWHAGPRASVKSGLPLSSAEIKTGPQGSRALEQSEINTIVRYFIEAGDRAARAGFDAAEVHAAHGYLLHNFVDQSTNRRHDGYGGSVENRYRILAEIRTGIRSMHPNFPVILRLSLRDDDDFQAIADVIQKAGFDAVDVRTGFSSMPKTDEGAPVSPGYTLKLARMLRPYLGVPLMTGGRILTPQEAEQAIAEVGLDAIVLGRPLLADPHWALKASCGQAITTCRYDCEPSCYSKFKEGEILHCVYHGRQE